MGSISVKKEINWLPEASNCRYEEEENGVEKYMKISTTEVFYKGYFTVPVHPPHALYFDGAQNFECAEEGSSIVQAGLGGLSPAVLHPVILNDFRRIDDFLLFF